MSTPATTLLFTVALAGASLVLAVVFSILVALTLFLLSAPLWYLAGYAGATLMLILCFVLVLGLAAYLTPALYRSFRYQYSQDDSSRIRP